jgi:hypothetical protein
MPEYEILQDAPEMTLGQVDNMPRPSAENKLSALSQDEMELFHATPSFDPASRAPNTFRMMGKSLVDLFTNVALDNPALKLRAIGREIEEEEPFRKGLEDRFGVTSRRQKIAEKLTSVSEALRDKFDMSPEETTPRNFWESLAVMGTQAIGTIGISAGASVAGGGAAAVAGAAPKVVKGAQLLGAAYASFSMEKPVLEREMLAAGFEAGFSDRMSTYYAIPVAMLDAGSFGFLTGVMKPVASRSASLVVEKMMERGVGRFLVKGVAEGTTEAMQGQIQTEFEVGLKLQSRDFQRDLSSRALEFTIGTFVGGGVGAIHGASQLQARKDAIKHLSQKYELDPSLVARAYDASTLETLDRVLDELSEEKASGVTAEVAERTKWVQKSLDRAMGREALNTPDQVEETNTKLLARAQERLDSLSAEIEKEGGTANEKQQMLKQRLESRISRLSGLVTQGGNVAQSELIQAGGKKFRAHQSMLTEIRNSFAAGRAYQVRDIGEVHEAFRRMLRGTKLSLKATKGVLKNVLSIKTSEEFNAKQGQVLSAIDTIVRGEKVESLRDVASDILAEMKDSKARNVGPKMQIFSEHLNHILDGKVPVYAEPSGDKVTDIARHAMETLVADLRENDTDVDAAERAVLALKDFYTGELARRLTYKAQVEQDNERIAESIVKGLNKKSISPRKAGLDAVRERLKRTGLFNFTFATPYTESFLSVANDIDAGQGRLNMEGTMVREFDPAKPYRAWMTLINRSRENIDDKLAEIYGPRYLETLTLNRTANFMDVEFTDGEKVNITKSAAMSLYMMQKNNRIRQQMIDIGYSEEWLDAFAEGNAFSKQDHAWMAQVDAVLQEYAKVIAPIFEKLTGKPFRLVDNYFMVQRYMFSEDNEVSDETPSIVKDMMDGAFESVDPFDDPKFKRRTRSKKDFILPAIEDAITRYSMDMNHFIAYAEYATKLDALLKDEKFASAISQNKNEGIGRVLNQFLKDIVDGSQSRVSDRAAMRANYQALGWLARNKIVSPRSGFMQLTALAGFTDPTASKPISSIDIANSILSLPEAIKSGELKNLLETGYMKERWLGAFDQAAKMAEETSRYAAFQERGRFDPRGIIRKLGTSKVIHEWMSISTRFGDRVPSVVGGWAVYRKVLAETGDKVKAVESAIKMIEEVNGSLDPGKTAEIYSRKDFVSTLFKVFTRSTSIYLDRYLRMHKAFAAGQITKAQYAKGLVLYHVWIPMFTSAVAMGAGAQFDDDEMKTMMLAGPLSYALLVGGMFKIAAATILKATGINEKFASGYDPGGDMLDGYARDVRSAFKHISEALEYPDVENMWGAVAYTGKVFDILPLPAGYLARQPEALMKILQGDWPEGLMEIVGYSSAATKVE